MDKLGDLTKRAFDPALNSPERLLASVDLARAHGVQEGRIMKTIEDLDAFMLS